MPVDPSDHDSSDEEQEFDWEPLRKNITVIEVADAVDVSDALNGLLCPIGHSVMRDPVVCEDGHSYERCNIVRWFAKHRTSPLTGKKLRHTNIIPNLALRKTIVEWLERHAAEKKSREDDNDARVETARVSESEERATREGAAKHGKEADDSATVENNAQTQIEQVSDSEEMARDATNESEEGVSVDVEMGRVSESDMKETREGAADHAVMPDEVMTVDTQKISVQASKSIMLKSEVICNRKLLCNYPTCISQSIGNGLCVKHGYRRKKCSHPLCQSRSKGNGVCVKHGYQPKKCVIDGCKKRAYTKRLCKSHGGGDGVCSVRDCSLPIFQQHKCNYHYKLVVRCEVIVTDEPSIMSFDQNIVEIILRFAGGWDDWERVITYARVCKSWKTTLTNRLSQIGLQEMEGGCHRKLNTDAFLVKLTERRFQDADTIYVPCDKAVDLYVNEVRLLCPNMKTLVHSKWLRVDRYIEFVQQGGVIPLQCQRMYKHDKPNKKGMAWVKWEWDKKIEEVYECQFLSQYTLGTQRQRKATDFYIRTK